MNMIEQNLQESNPASKIRRGIDLLCTPGSVHEIRCVDAGKFRTIAGYYDDFDNMAVDAMTLSDVLKVPTVYFTLNPVNPALLARYCNAFQKYAKHTTSDKDVPRLLRLLIDLDAQRPAGISSTDEEHNLALEKVKLIQADLSAKGWPQPARCDSGNGGHLIYAIDLENSPENVKLLETVLKSLHAIYSDDRIKVDITTYNPARICKMPGTIARKGEDFDSQMPRKSENLEDRPHRRAEILEAPETLCAVPEELLRELVGQPAVKPGAFDRAVAEAFGETVEVPEWIEPLPTAGGAWTPEQLETWLASKNVKHKEPVEDGERLKYVLDACVFNADHVGRDAAVFLTIEGEEKGLLGFKCFHDSCADKGWKELREKLEPVAERKPKEQGDTAWIDDLEEEKKPEQPKAEAAQPQEKPRDPFLMDLLQAGVKIKTREIVKGSDTFVVDCPCCGLEATFWRRLEDRKTGYECTVGRKTWAQGKLLWANITEPGTRKRKGFLVDELDAIPTPTWIVKEHLLTDSLAVIYGPSNVGKTFFGLDIGLSVATGTKFAGQFDVKPAPVAYVIGEGVGGVKKRIKAWKKEHGYEGRISNFVVIPYQFALATVDPSEAKEIVSIAVEKLGGKPSLVLIDTLARNFGAGANENDTSAMGMFVQSCDLIKAESDASVAVVHHTGKDESKGMRGAYALVGGADTIIYCGEHGHRAGMEIECEKQKDVDFFEPYLLKKEVVDLGNDESSLAFRYEGIVFKSPKKEDTLAGWSNDGDIVHNFAPDTLAAAQTKAQIEAAVKSGMLSRQMKPLGEKRIRTIIDTLVLNGRLTKTGGEKNPNHTKFFKNQNPSGGEMPDFFSGEDIIAE